MQEFDDDLIPLGDALKDREWERLFDQALADVTLALMPAATTAAATAAATATRDIAFVDRNGASKFQCCLC